ncbi:MAG: AAA family ATPase [Candidatus Paceibacterota bacterium]
MSAKKILVMGLPGSGKTYFSERLVPKINAVHLNADKVREKFNDWDFSEEGRLRQSKRMSDLADEEIKNGNHVVADFVSPTKESREIFNPDIVIWLDTISEGRFEDTNKIFVAPEKFDFRITSQNADYWSAYISKRILGTGWDSKSPTTQLLGRWQPWHEGHRALFERAIEKTGQVFLMIRDVQGVGDNPFDFESAAARIREDLSDKFEEDVDYKIQLVPNLVHITYGRTVGYKIEQEFLGEELESISATKKREELRERGELT